MFTALTLLLIATCLVLPIVTRQREIEQDHARQRLRFHQLKWVRKSYPELHELTYREIAQRYNVTDAYENINVYE